MSRQLTPQEWKALNNPKRIAGKRLKRVAREKGVKKERTPDPREKNYYE